MKKSLKIFLIVFAILWIIEALSVIKLLKGVDYEKRYKDLFDKTFDGNYTLTVKDSGSASSKNGETMLPVKYKEYDLKYFDKDGNERQFSFCEKKDYQLNILSLVKIPRWALYQNFDADRNLAVYLEAESKSIFLDQMEENVGRFFGSDIISDESGKISSMSRVFDGDGIRIRCATLDIGTELVEGFGSYKYIIPRKSKDRLEEIVSPETCMVLSKQEIKDYASQKTAWMFFTVFITDEDILKNENKLTKAAEKYRDSADEMMNFYCGLSDFGGNCQYSVGVETDHEDKDADGWIFKKYVCMGEELEKIEGNTMLNEVRKANGLDISKLPK
ncbi:MAG: hypothetical protein K6B74_01835 [Ruminococcus sp.]|nr:hypothetical protein [Ruminococcus sp.]